MSEPMPPEVAAAVCAVMAGITKLGKGQENDHAKYKFAGIDAFLELTRPLCAAAGLIITQDEESFEIVGNDKPWLLIRYTFTLSHSSGATWATSPRRSIMVQASMGAQAFGAAQSYAEKQFLRSLFQIATGENEDADTHAQLDLPVAKSEPIATKGKGAARKDYTDLVNDMRSCGSVALLDDFMALPDTKLTYRQLPRDWQDEIVQERRTLNAKLVAAEAVADITMKEAA